VIVKATAIPLAYYPYSSTSRIVHWLTRHHGKISTLLKGALRPKSLFLGEYDLFSTSELLYIARRPHTLYSGKECSLIHARSGFRNDWRAMQTASYISAMFNYTTPDEAPHPGLFELYEELLDGAEKYGRFHPYIFWAEQRFCAYHGHTPNLECCSICQTRESLHFSPAAGGVVCDSCAKSEKLSTLSCSLDGLEILRGWQNASQPEAALKISASEKQVQQLHRFSVAFMKQHFNLQPEYRNAVSAQPSSERSH
jgi:DNA repair protein RecO (recombination protein O)